MAKKNSNTEKKLFDMHAPVPSMSQGYYSGDQPNPNLTKFVIEHGTPYDPVDDDYKVKAFHKPLTVENRRDALNDLHIYWSKKPYVAIAEYILHYTHPQDIVFDPFCGSGGTGLASVLHGRNPILIDRSPAATFITTNYCSPLDVPAFDAAVSRVNARVQKDMLWLYETKCDRCSGPAMTAYTVYSQVFQCSRCLSKVALYDCPETQITTSSGKPKTVLCCPACLKQSRQEAINIEGTRYGCVPVVISYICQGKCKAKRGKRTHQDASAKKRKYVEQYDLAKVNEIEAAEIPFAVPDIRMMNAEEGVERWGLLWRPYLTGIERVSDFYTKRNLWAMGALLDAINAETDHKERLLFAFSGMIYNASRMYRERKAGGGPAEGVYYVPPIFREVVVPTLFTQKCEVQKRSADLWPNDIGAVNFVVSTQSATDVASVPANSVDYIFTDPPYSWKVQYGESNFLWEAWLGLDHKWHHDEIIVNEVRGRSVEDWSALMLRAMQECFRVLKPGRWLSLCYHDTSEGTWEIVQDMMAEAGFVTEAADIPLYIETGQKAWKQTVADKVSKRDLVINYRKPSPGELRATQVFIPADADVPTFQQLAKEIVRDYLTRHPGATKDRVYDTVVSRMVRKGQMEAHDFEAVLRSVAEEIEHPVKEDLFRNKEADLFGSHLQSRWYLKETADQIDQAEQAKEDSSAIRLEKFIGEYLDRMPEVEGVHYSDLFEQYLPVRDKPRRLLADWLPEYFIKCPTGTWRLPNVDEGKQLAQLREAGTLRRIKRFANALIDGVPVREKDRPGSDVDLLDWLRQCRRAGLYEQGRAIYEKGGLNSANLTDEQQIEAEDDYRICVRRGSSEEAKPKRKTKKKQNDDE